MVDCAEFLDSYSDFRDGFMSSERKAGFEAHIQVCGSCARYDRVVGGGVQVFRSLPPVTPSADFQDRLLRRLYATDGAMGRHGSGASVAVTLMICLALGAGAWLPALRPQADPVRLPPIVAHAPYHDLAPVLMQGSARGMAASVFQPQPAFYGQGLLLDQSTALTTLAYRPASAIYTPR
jgi:hypothetical protein